MNKVWMYAGCVIVLFFSFAVSAQDKNSVLEDKIGATTYELVKKTQGFYDNPALLAEVESIGRSLEKQLSFKKPLKYFLVDTSEPNAFATAGGYVFVTRGLLAVIDTRDELAGIMAHELSHVTLHHATKKLKVSIVPLVLELPGNIIGLLTVKEAAGILNIPVKAVSELGIAAYSRSQEKEADTHGIALAIKAGFNPFGLVYGLERITRYAEFVTGHPMKKTLLIDHPMTSERVAYLTEILTKKGFARTEYFHGTDIAALQGLVYGQNPKEGIIDSMRFVQPEIGLYCEFPSGWAIQNSPVTVMAVAPEKNATMIVSVDSSATTPSEAALKSLGKLKESTIAYQEETTVNGLQAYRATVRSKNPVHAGHVSELLWIKLPTFPQVLKIVGISSSAASNKKVVESLLTFRPVVNADLADIKVKKINLVERQKEKAIDAYVQGEDTNNEQRTLLAILNGVAAGERIEEGGKFIKIIHSKPLSQGE